MIIEMLFPIAVLLTIGSAILITSLFCLIHRHVYLISLFLVGYANIILSFEIASLFGQINPFSILLIQSILFVFALLIWVRAKKPNLFPKSFSGFPSLTELQRWAAGHPLLAGMLLVTGSVYLFNAALVIAVPPNNVDSMTYHLARIGYWIQHGTLSPWPTNNPRQTTFPFNAELAIMWSMLFLRSDRLAGFVQWFSMLVSAISIYGLAIQFKANRSQALFAALLWATFPQVILQSTTTQNDLVTTAFFVSGVYLLFLGLNANRWGILGLSALAVGLGIGTKTTFLMAEFSFIIGVAIWWLLGRSRPKRLLLVGWAGLCLAGAIGWGAFAYAQNYIYYRNPLSSENLVTGMVNTAAKNPAAMAAGNTLIYLYQAVDLSGIPDRIAAPLWELKRSITAKVLNKIRVYSLPALDSSSWSLGTIISFPHSTHEDISWFGIVFIISFIPALLWQTRQAVQKKEEQKLILLFSIAALVLLISALLAWTPYKSRYFHPAVALGAPFMAFLYPSAPRRRSFYLYFLIPLSLIILITTVITNRAKPLVGENAIWGKDRLQIQTSNRPDMRDIVDMVDKYVPSNSSLAIKTGMEGWDYLFFGPALNREIYQIGPAQFVSYLPDVLERKIDFILIEPHQREFLHLPDGLYWVDEEHGWVLFTLDQTKARPAEQDNELLIGAADSQNLISIGEPLIGQVGLIDMGTSAWGVEQYLGSSILWIGESRGYGLYIYLWSTSNQKVRFLMDVAPGPSRMERERTLQLNNYTEGNRTVLEQSFSSETRVEFSTELLPGRNDFLLSTQDAVNIWKLPKGDQRPLIILLKHITVLP